VIRIRRSLEVLEVATDARRVRRRQVVVPVHVALAALDCGVCAGKREARGRVIERRTGPVRRRVALLARRRETRLHVIRIGCAIEIFYMARCAIRRSSHELVVDMALRAGNAGMSAGQRKFGECSVIECRRIPRAHVVAEPASCREAGLRVWRIVGFIEVRHVAAHAGRRRAHKFSAGVAGVAVERGMRAHQRETRELQVIELRAHPVVHGVALLAGDGQVQRNVINARGPGVGEIFLMAGVAESAVQ